MVCIGMLSAFSALVLLAPPQALAALLELMNVPVQARLELIVVVGINVVLSVGFEKWCQEVVASMVGTLIRRRRRERRLHGKVYKAVESVY